MCCIVKLYEVNVFELCIILLKCVGAMYSVFDLWKNLSVWKLWFIWENCMWAMYSLILNLSNVFQPSCGNIIWVKSVWDMNALDPVHLGQTVEKPLRWFWKKFHWEVLRVLKVSWRAPPQKTVKRVWAINTLFKMCFSCEKYEKSVFQLWLILEKCVWAMDTLCEVCFSVEYSV